jgi:hypothetical protein
MFMLCCGRPWARIYYLYIFKNLYRNFSAISAKSQLQFLAVNNCFLPLYLSFFAEYSAIWQQCSWSQDKSWYSRTPGTVELYSRLVDMKRLAIKCFCRLLSLELSLRCNIHKGIGLLTRKTASWDSMPDITIYFAPRGSS